MREHAACGVGFVASRDGIPRRRALDQALRALACVEHRGGCLADGKTGDGAGIMAEVPFELLGYPRGEVAVAQLFLMQNAEGRRRALDIFTRTFAFMGLELVGFRDVPVDTSVLGRQARDTLPAIVQAFVRWPAFCRTASALNALLYRAKQATRTQLRRAGIVRGFFFVSLSTTTIVYKALVKSEALEAFYPDLQDPRFTTRFALFHRRFSTNTSTSWDKAQPFRVIAHNGEINTIECNRTWSYAREQAMGLPPDELLTHKDISDSGSLNEMVEALRYRSSIPQLSEILAIMAPPARTARAPFYEFWRRAVEPWDGPAFLAYSDGEIVGARLDRNGFRPCRWAMTEDSFYLASEAGIFALDEREILAKGLLHGGSGTHVVLDTGEVRFDDPADAPENAGASFDARLEHLGRAEAAPPPRAFALFRVSREEVDDVLVPMITSGKEPIGSMGDTARPFLFSDEPRSLFDAFYQGFAQVTNPPLDHLRERVVTELGTYLGARPNVFAPKTLIPIRPGIELDSPILDLEQMAWVRRAATLAENGRCFETAELALRFARADGPAGLGTALERLEAEVLEAVRGGASIVILSDRGADVEHPPVPSLLALVAAVGVLEQHGHRLDASIVVDTADARTTHHVAALVGFGAAAVCPYLVFGLARDGLEGRVVDDSPAARVERLRRVYEAGLLKVMSKVGISTVLGYQGSKLFTPVGLGPALLARWFRGVDSPLGGYEVDDLGARILAETATAAPTPARAGATPHDGLRPTFQLREHPKGLVGERHAMTAALSRRVHALVDADAAPLARWDLYEAFVAEAEAAHPVSPRHLLELVPAERPIALEDVQPREEILRRFGSGSISFGAISAESQRDVILAMRAIGGRSGSGEGGESPFYATDGVSATTKQVASARFGVTAQYLVSGEEIEIKVAQGAKPGEGGQLMAVKVDADIARARYALPGVDLISPPPLHDIYSIEDLRELIYELKQLKPGVPVVVKLVAGAGIGAIACGVVKAGADVIHLSGGDGGTGAASLSSMKHAGLPWELGLVEVHQALTEQQLREHVTLRVDGGLSTGRDVVVAALLGAEEVAFGKLLLVAEGCIMARVCEKNTCPRGIATHDPRFKAKYRGRVDAIVSLMTYLAEDVRRHLATLGVARLDQVIGRGDLLRPAAAHRALVEARRIDLSRFTVARPHARGHRRPHLVEGTSRLNQRLAEDVLSAIDRGEAIHVVATVASTDRAVLATLSGELALRAHHAHLDGIARRGGGLAPTLPEGLLSLPPRRTSLPSAGASGGLPTSFLPSRGPTARPALADPPRSLDPGAPLGLGAVSLELHGSAGQGFAVFLVPGLDVTLVGEANDSVAKSMHGGRVVVRPPSEVRYVPEENAIIGNGALYGATGGRLFVRGRAGDRFAVRNSGATAAVEGAGLHACEYMTQGLVVILGPTSVNVGAGMTGGELFLRRVDLGLVNAEYLTEVPIDDAALATLTATLDEHQLLTGSTTAAALLAGGTAALRAHFARLVPLAVAARMTAERGAAEWGGAPRGAAEAPARDGSEVEVRSTARTQAP